MLKVSGHEPQLEPSSELRTALARCRDGFLLIGLFTAVLNVLALTGAMYMLQLYDRVLPSHSVPTLVGLTVLMLFLYAIFGVLDLVRTKMLSRLGLRIERALRDRVIASVVLLPLRTRVQGDGLQPVRDLDQIRGFLSGLGPTALFDLPWMVLYLGIVWMLHPWLGMLGMAGAALLVAVTLLTERCSIGPEREAVALQSRRNALGASMRSNAEALRVLGMGPSFTRRWSDLTEKHITQQIGSADVVATFGSASKVLRMVLQSAVLGLAAYLVILGQVSGGVMIAASILVARAVAPVEVAIANWRGFVVARQSWRRLEKILATLPCGSPVAALPPPVASLSVEGLWVSAPGATDFRLQNVSFTLGAGDGLGIIGPAGSGKTTLARALVGVWPAQHGSVRFDGAALDQWSEAELGRHIGYLPQSIELFAGTVFENIARFQPNATSEAVIAAARNAGVHDLIVRLPSGYDTDVGEGGAILSAGQRQRIALARALYGDPFLLVLDEPNSNLDASGDTALTEAILAHRARGGIAVIIAHRPSALAAIDSLLLVADGRIQAFGPKDKMLAGPAAMATGNPAAASHLKVVADGQQGGSR